MMTAITFLPLFSINPELLPMLGLISLILAAVAIVLAVCFFLSFNGFRYSLRDEIADVVLHSERVDSFVRSYVPKKDNVVRLSKESVDAVADLVYKMVEVRAMELVLEQKKETTDKPDRNRKRRFYAPACNDSGSFSALSTRPDDGTTIYALDVDEEMCLGTFFLYEGAEAKVLGCKDYLENACLTEGSGENIVEQEPGIVVLHNGRWLVKSKLVVKFD